MKKIISLLLALMMIASLLTLTACSQNSPDASADNTDNSDSSSVSSTLPPETDPPAPTYDSALDLYTAVWNVYGDENKFACAGGDADHESMDGPGQFVLNDTNAETFKYLLHVTDELYDMLEDDVATLQHMMNINTFSSAVAKLKDPTQASAFATAYQAAIQGQNWMCGFPDKVVVISIGDYVVMAFGHEGNIDHLTAACSAVDAQASVLVDAPAMVE